VLVKNEKGIIMSEPEKTDNVETPAKVDQQTAESKNTEHMIPKSRFDEVNREKNELRAQLEAAKQAAKEGEEQRLIEKESFKELYEKAKVENETLRPKAAMVDDMEKALRKSLDAQLAELPEHVRNTVPAKYTTQDKLDWLAENRSILMKPKAFDIGAGKQGGEAPETITLTPEQAKAADRLGIKHEDYAKNL
jgi:ribonucleoside-triphosphate reductase